MEEVWNPNMCVERDKQQKTLSKKGLHISKK